MSSGWRARPGSSRGGSARVGEPDLLHEGQRRGAVAPRPGPDAQVVGVDVERADQVADPVPAVVGRAVTLGAPAPGPAAAVTGAEALRPLLVEADHDTVFGLLTVEREQPRRLRLVVGIRALFPAPACAAARSRCGRGSGPGARARPRSLPAQIAGKLGQAPAREGHPERVGTGAGERDDPCLVVSRDPAGSPAPDTRAQRIEPVPVELVDHLAHMRLVREQHPRDLGALINVFEASRINARCLTDDSFDCFDNRFNRCPSSGANSRTNTSGGRIDTSSGRMRPDSTPPPELPPRTRSNILRRRTSRPGRDAGRVRVARSRRPGRGRARGSRASPAPAAGS